MSMGPPSGFAEKINTFNGAIPQGRSTSSLTASDSRSGNVRWCLFLIYYFSVCDVFLKYVPVTLAFALRYLPEAVLYCLVFILLWKRLTIRAYPLFWPLAMCLATMACSGIVNLAAFAGVLSDFRSFFRFSAFTYILWRTNITSQRVRQFIDGFFRLTVFELVIGAIEVVGGPTIREFFSPAVGWGSGKPLTFEYNSTESGTWLNGTLMNYNNYGMFMTMSLVLALSMYSAWRSRKYLWLAAACLLAVVLSFSRHSLILVAFALAGLFWLNRKKLLTGRNRARFLSLVALGTMAAVIGIASSSIVRGRLASIAKPDVVQGDPASNMRLYMTVVLTPRFLSAYPLLGQGPIAAADSPPAGTDDRSLGPTMKAAPEMPGWVTFYIADVVWVMVLGLYGCCGLATFGLVFWSIARTATYLSNNSTDPVIAAVGHGCLVAVGLFIVSGFFSEEMIARDTIPVFWCLSGIAFSLRRSTPRLVQQ